MESMGLEIESMKAMHSAALDINKFEGNAASEEAKGSTADLYKASKAFIEALTK